MKKLLAILLVLMMAFSVVACKDSKDSSSTTPGGDSSSSSGGDVVGGEEELKYWVKDTAAYTYRMAPSDLPTSWNYHTYETASSTYVLDYSSDALYTFDYNDDFTGFQIVPSMAKDFPVDVTADYVGSYGITEEDAIIGGKAYKITLKDYLKYDNGDPITAHSFERSMLNLLNPQAANFRADNVYKSGNVKIYNAEAYAKNGLYAFSDMLTSADVNMANYAGYIPVNSFVADENGILQYNGKDLGININDGGLWGDELFLFFDYGYFGTDLEIDEATGRVKVFAYNENYGAGYGDWIMTREQLEDGTRIFYDLDGNKLPAPSQDGTYFDKDGNAKPEWANASARYYSPAFSPLFEAANEDGEVKLTAALLKNVQDAVAILHGCADVDDYAAALEEAGKDPSYAYIEWEELGKLGSVNASMDYKGNVGFFAASDDELVIVLQNAMEDNFYLRYELCTSFFLVHNPTYESCISMEGGVYSNSYGTSIDTYVGYGPYKLTSFLADSNMKLTRNTHWHGYYEADKEGQYQTNGVQYTVVKDDETRLQMFLKGELDGYGLRAEDMDDYVSSKYTYFDDSESTWFVATNPDVTNLTTVQASTDPVVPGNAVVKTPLAIKEFRQALSYSLNRTDFILQLNPMSSVAKALLSSMMVSDPDAGEMYRTTEEAKDAILEFWGLADQVGEGKPYATKDAAIASVTGYDIGGAKDLFTTAYNKAVEAGYITAEMIETGKWEMQIMIGASSWSSSFYSNGYTFLKTCWTNAVAGTPFEGHLTFVQSEALGSTGFGNALKEGRVDLLFGVGFSGSMFDPYGFMEVFTGSLAYDAFTDKDQIYANVEYTDGSIIRASLADWVAALSGTEINAIVVDAEGNPTTESIAVNAGVGADMSFRRRIMAKIEVEVMNTCNMMPLMTDASASMRCMRVVYKTEEYILGAGRGGIQYYTYTHSDAEFAAYVADQGGILDYTVSKE